MSTTKSNFSPLTPEQKTACVNDIIDFFLSERDEEIGVIAAEELVELILEKASPIIYNRGVEDSKSLLQDRLTDLTINLDLLKRKL